MRISGIILQIAAVAWTTQLALPQTRSATASVRGIVRRSDTGGPLSGATVELRRSDGTSPQTYSAVTDRNGTFALVNLRPGEYQLFASRSGFLPSTYGQRRLGGSGVSIDLTAGQSVDNIETTVTPAGVISGRIRDQDGDPVGAAAVQALIPAYQDGQRILKPVQVAFTNDLGEYRLFGLMPGQYYLVTNQGLAELSSFMNSMSAAAPDQMRVYLNSLYSRSALPPGTTYLPIYYPGTTDVRSARALELVVGANLGGVDFTAGPVPTRHIRGTVEGGGASVTLVPMDPAAASLSTANHATTNDGPFDFRAVAPGPYLVVATSGDLSGSMRLDVRDADVENIRLRLGNPIIIPTHVGFDDRVSSGNDPDLDLVRLQLIPDTPSSQIKGDTYSPFPDGSMGFEVIMGESYRIKLETTFDTAGKLSNAYIKSIRMGTRDVLTEGLQFAGEPDPRIEVVIGTKTGSLSGIVMATAKGKSQPVVNTTVVLVPDAARRRRPELFRIATSDGGGRFQMSAVIPGDYRVFAWDDVENGAWQDPDFLRVYEELGTAVHIADAGKADVTVALLPSR